MAQTIVAIYDDIQPANTAVRDLVDHGVPRERISLITNHTHDLPGAETATGRTQPVAVSRPENEAVAPDTGKGMGVGAGIGATVGGIGGLLIGLGALTLPGIGPVLAAGPLAVALSTLIGAGAGAVTGGLTGGLLGALIGLGIPEEEAEYYTEGVRRGGVLVAAQAQDANTEQVVDIMNRYHPIDIHQRAAQWREQGWTNHDAAADAPANASAMTQPVRRTNEPDQPDKG